MKAEFLGKNPIIYRCVSSGLANRLRALAGYATLAEFLNVPFYLHWRPDRACDCLFTELYEPGSITLINKREMKLLQRDSNATLFSRNLWYSHIFESMVENNHHEQLNTKALGLLRSLVPIKAIRDELNLFIRQNLLQNRIGIHIRYTDNLKSYSRRFGNNSHFCPERKTTLEGYLEFMAEEIASNSTRFFLATDSQLVEDLVLQTFPSNDVLVYPKAYSRGLFSLPGLHRRTTSIEIAMTEMLLLASCASVIGTYFSSYSKMSALLGDIPYHEIVSGKLVTDPLYEYSKRPKNNLIGPLMFSETQTPSVP